MSPDGQLEDVRLRTCTLPLSRCRIIVGEETVPVSGQYVRRGGSDDGYSPNNGEVDIFGIFSGILILVTPSSCHDQCIVGAARRHPSNCAVGVAILIHDFLKRLPRIGIDPFVIVRIPALDKVVLADDIGYLIVDVAGFESRER